MLAQYDVDYFNPTILLILYAILTYILTYTPIYDIKLSPFITNIKIDPLNSFDTNFTLLNKVFYMSVKDKSNLDDLTYRSLNYTSKYPEFKVELFDDNDCLALIQLNYTKYLDLYTHLPFGVMKSDFCRYLFIFHHGGIYIDSDVLILSNPNKWGQFVNKFIQAKPIQLIVGLEVIDFDHWKKHLYSNPLQILQWSFAANPNHPILRNCLQDIYNNFQLKQSEFADISKIIDLTGPGVMTRNVHHYITQIYPNIRILLDAPIVIGDVYIGGLNFMDCGTDLLGIVYNCTKSSATQHLFGGRWKSEVNYASD
eukprot:NODE_639_length_5118_cov_0.568440.p3 type:complete len:311 gc:universal NODE_639_length_5118_cov_0.568440:1141-2073(+)